MSVWSPKLLRQIKIEKRLHLLPVINIIIPIFSIVLALLLSGVFLSIKGIDPVKTFMTMLKGSFGSAYGFSETIIETIPILIASLGVSVAFKMKLWNIGAEGQIYMGAFAASGVALFFPQLPAYVMLPAMLLAGFLAGAVWALIPAIPKAFLDVNETIVTLMLNYVAILWVDYLVYGPWKDPKGFNFPFSPPFPPAAMLPVIPGTRIHLGIVLALIFAVVLFILFKNTTWGYQIKVIGQSSNAARYAGMNIKRYIMLVMLISGGLAGIAGMGQVSGVIGKLQHTISTGYGYTAIIVAYLAKLNPLVIVIVSLLFGGLVTGGYAIEVVGLPSQIVTMLQGAILFFVLGGEILARYRFTFKNSDER